MPSDRTVQRPCARTLRSLTLLLLLVAAVAGVRPAAAQDKRRFAVDDLFELEGIGSYFGGPYAFAPDEARLAFTRVRPKKELANHKWEYLWGNAGGDVWIQDGAGQAPYNLTQGASDGSGWWSPQWSPDGRRLAMLSTRGGNVNVWVWTVGTRDIERVSDRGVNLVDVRERPYVWVDANRLLVPVLPAGEQPLGMIVELQTPMIASAAWARMPAGDVVTASVLESGLDDDVAESSKGELLLFDLAERTSTTIALGSTANWQLSPDGRFVVFSRQLTVYRPQANEPLAFGDTQISTVQVMSIAGVAVDFGAEVPSDVLARSLRWSPDGGRLAFFARAGDSGVPRLFIAQPATATITSRLLSGIDVTPIVREEPQLEWAGSGELIAQAAEGDGGGIPDPTARRDWWSIAPSDGTAPRKLTGAMEAVPGRLWPQEGRAAFFGVAGGQLWRITPGSSGAASLENLTQAIEDDVTTLAWPAMTNAGTDQYRVPGAAYEQAIVTTGAGEAAKNFRVDLEGGTIAPIERPSPGAQLVAYAPTAAVAIFYADDRDGLGVWRHDLPSGIVQPLVQANGFLDGIEEGALQPIEYTSLDGENLHGWLILPVGFRPGDRVPLIVWVYAGAVYSERQPSTYLTSINSNLSLNMQIPAANGYAVLLPSMPLAPEGVADDPMLQLPNGVLPAVDEVVELGIADPARLFVMGQSFGGFSTYGLVTQTNRFAGAVSMAGLSDLISLYGQFDARERYTDRPHEDLFMMSLMESAQVRLGGPPWQNLGRYLRNSPIFYVDRVQTPVMIIQGDLDYVAIQQGEEFFMSLYRQGKRAKFVRYWGEGHVLESPANIRDMWQRIFEWFDELSPDLDGGAS